MITLTPEAYLESILAEIERTRERGGTGVYRINEKVSDELPLYVKAYFENKAGYTAEIKKCKSCLNTWDVMIFFMKL